MVIHCPNSIAYKGPNEEGGQPVKGAELEYSVDALVVEYGSVSMTSNLKN